MRLSFLMYFLCLGSLLPAQDSTFIWNGGNLCDEPGYQPAFQDSFFVLDTTRWARYYPHWQTGKDDFFESRTHDVQREPPFRELQVFTNEQVTTGPEGLRLTAVDSACRWMGVEKPYVSGMIHTLPGWGFGRGKIAVTARLPKGRGLWPAIWLFGSNGYGGLHEIDIMEMGCHRTRRWFSNVYRCYEGPGCSESVVHRADDLSDGFHEFGLELTPFFLIWTLDGVEVRRLSRLLYPDGEPVLTCEAAAGVYRVNPLFPGEAASYSLIINLAVSNGAFGGPPNERSQFPAAMEVRAVQVWTE